MDTILEMQGITKSFPGVQALDKVSLKLYRGEILALLGENGAGKSTLMKILSGAYTPDAGTICLDGEKLQSADPRKMLSKGVAVVYQELNYYNDLNIAENIYTGNLPMRSVGGVSFKKLYQQTEELLRQVGLKHSPKTLVSTLSVAEKQMLEIAKALAKDAKVLVMDEPTSALNDTEVQTLFHLLRGMTEKGISIIYISHKMDEIFEISDRVQVLRDGCSVGCVDTKDATVEQLVSMMVGRTITDMYPKSDIPLGEPVLEVSHLEAERVHDVSFSIRAGEIVGLFGLMGAGRTEIVETIFGRRKHKSGTIRVSGKDVEISCPRHAIRAGIGYVPRERKQDGLVLPASVGANITYAYLKDLCRCGFIDAKKEQAAIGKWMEKLRIKAPGASTCVNTLSGGNQQKAVIAKWLQGRPKVMILNEPTRGVDVGAKVEIYNLMEELCREGMAILMISSEMPEILGVADRVLVVRDSCVVGECSRDQFSQEQLMRMAIGVE